MKADLVTPPKIQPPSFVFFFLLAYLFSWLIWGLLLLFPEVLGEMAFLVILGAFGPFAAAALLTRRTRGKEAAKSWRRTVLRWRGRFQVIILAGLGLSLLISFTHIALYALLFQLPAMQTEPPWYWLLPAIPINVYLVFVYSSAFGEEPGWQGYAMPRLLHQFSPPIACLILGLFWAVWHLPLHFTPLWKGQEPLLWMILYAVPLTMILTWLTQIARGSVMPAVFLHYATNLYGQYLLGTDIFQQPLANSFTEIKTVIYWGLAIFLLWKTKGTLGYQESGVASV